MLATWQGGAVHDVSERLLTSRRSSCAPDWCTRTKAVNLCTILVHGGLFHNAVCLFGSRGGVAARGPHRPQARSIPHKNRLSKIFFCKICIVNFTM